MDNRRIRQALFVLVIVVVGTFGFWWLFFSTPPTSYEIQTVEMSRGSIERSISATGAVEALVTVDVSSQLSGQISNVNVDFNSPVEKNAVLAVIDPRTFAARVASAEATLAIAKTNVALEEASVAKAKALLSQAESNVVRHKKLAPIKATPAATLEAAETQAATAKADLQVAVAKLANARANVTKGEADLSQAKLDLDRTQIRSPINGVVIARNVDPGGTVAASLQAPVLFQIAQDLTQVQILVLVDEADIGSIKEGQAVTFTVDAFPDRVFSGKVAQVRIAGTTTSNVVTYTVVVRAQNPQQKLLPGMTATVRIITGTRRNVLRVPNEAVRFLPPKGMKTTKAAKRPNRDEAIVTRLSEKLALTEEQTGKFREGMAAARFAREQRRNNSRKKGGKEDETSTGVPARRGVRAKRRAFSDTSARRGRIMRVLEGILTPEQMKAFKVLHEEWRDATTPANVWTETPKGLQPHRLLLGLTDDSFSEVLRGTLKKGDRVVTRAKRNGAKESQRGRRSRR